MKTVLIIATVPTQASGYSRVCQKISNHLANNFNVHIFGFHNYPQTRVDRFVDPRITVVDVLDEENKRGFNDKYGDKLIHDHILDIKPDILLIYNDILVVSRMFNAINDNKTHTKHNFKVCVYIDLVYEFERNECITYLNDNADMILTFADFWTDSLVKQKVSADKIHTVYHGCDTYSTSISTEEARERFNFHPEDFVILNANRNSYRKALDITIKSFLIFIRNNDMNKHLKLFLTCEYDTKSGYNILDMIKNLCLESQLDYDQVVQDHILTSSTKPLSDQDLATLFKATDIGVNTCVGEGFGLCPVEHLSFGRHQVLSNVGPISEMFTKETATLIDPVASLYVPNHTDYHNGFINICRAEDFADAYHKCYDDRTDINTQTEKYKRDVLDKFCWDNSLKTMEMLLDSLL